MAESSTVFYKKAPPDRGASSFIYPPSSANLQFFADALRAGCVVAIPTETVYGLAALALEEEFCRSIFAIKGRPLMDPLIVHVPGPEMVESLAHLPESFHKLSEAFWPGPLTLILKKRSVIPALVTAGKDTVAVRMPRHPVALSLLTKLGEPVAAPSANPFGYISPSRARHVAESFGSRVPFVIDGGECEIGLESTILDISGTYGPAVRILRPGAIGPREVEAVLGERVQDSREVVQEETPATAPGTMARHYSPASPLSLFEETIPSAGPEEAIVFLQRPPPVAHKGNIFWFSESGEDTDIAKSLFALLRSLDNGQYREIHCQIPTPDGSGLRRAIRDRLMRAAAG